MLKLIPFLVHKDESHCSEDGENQDDRDNHEVQEVFIMRFLSMQEKKSQNSITCQDFFFCNSHTFGIESDENHGKPTFNLNHIESYGLSPRPVSGERRSPHTGRIVPRSQI